jgi:hypothetical protein
MADEPFSLSVDNDWKRQAQEEKRKLVEEQAKKAAEAAAPVASAGPMAAVAPGATPEAAPAGRTGARGKRELPPASFTTLVSSIMTQTLYYLGEIDARGGEGSVNLDMAKHQIDTLTMLEEKTANHLSDEERKSLDVALYELRNRFVSVASQYIL